MKRFILSERFTLFHPVIHLGGLNPKEIKEPWAEIFKKGFTTNQMFIINEIVK